MRPAPKSRGGLSLHIIKTWIIVVGLTLALSVGAQAETIAPREAAHYVGSQATVAGVVSQVSRSKGGTTFINFGGRFPKHVFYAVIFANRASAFPGIFDLEGKSVQITGDIQLYKGKPQIIVSSPNQIQLQ